MIHFTHSKVDLQRTIGNTCFRCKILLNSNENNRNLMMHSLSYLKNIFRNLLAISHCLVNTAKLLLKKYNKKPD